MMLVRMAQLTSEVKAVLISAQDEARSLGHGYIGTEHLLVALLASPTTPPIADLITAGAGVDTARAAAIGAFEAAEHPNRYAPDAEVLGSIGIDAEAVRAKVEATHGAGSLDTRVGTPPFTARVGNVLVDAVARAEAGQRDRATTDDLLVAIRSDTDCVAERYLVAVMAR